MELVDVFPDEDTLHVLSKEAVQRAATELGETEDTRSTALAKLREALLASLSDANSKTAPILQGCKDLMSDAFLVKFLRARNYNVDHAHQLVVNYCLFQQNHPFLFTDLSADAVRPVLEAGIFAVLPKRDRLGRVVFLFFPARHHLSEIPFDHMLRACVYILERAVRSAETQVNGIVLLEDFSGFTLKQALASKARDLKNLVTLAQDCFPARLSAIHMVKQPMFIKVIMSIIRPFLAEAVRRTIHMHGTNFVHLHQEFAPDTLPSEFGGTTGPVNTEKSTEMLLGNIQYST